MPRQILRFTDRGNQTVAGGVVIEEPLEIRIDSEPVAVLMRTPGMEKELAAGWIFGQNGG